MNLRNNARTANHAKVTCFPYSKKHYKYRTQALDSVNKGTRASWNHIVFFLYIYNVDNCKTIKGEPTKSKYHEGGDPFKLKSFCF